MVNDLKMAPQRSILALPHLDRQQFKVKARDRATPIITTIQPEWQASNVWKEPDFWRMHHGKAMVPLEISPFPVRPVIALKLSLCTHTHAQYLQMALLAKK